MQYNKKTVTVEVLECRSCPFFTVEGMEHMMICGHPFWLDKPAYSGAIITQSNRDSIPEKCPLRHVQTTTTQTVRLRS